MAIEFDVLRRLTRGWDDHEHPAWSPNGTHLAYYAGPYGHINLYLIGADGRGVRPLTAARGNHTQAAWTPDGRYVAYRAQPEPGAPWAIWQLEAEFPERKTVLLRAPGVSFKHPHFSSDGTWLTYFSDEGSPDNFHVWVQNLETGQRRQLTFAADRNDAHPVWSPNDTWIAFHAYVGLQATETQLAKIRPDGSELTWLTDERAWHKHPFFVGDDYLVYHHEEPDGRRNIRLIRADGDPVAELTSGKNNDKHPHPFVSPDGRVLVAFASKKRGEEDEGEDYSYDIFVGEVTGLKV